MQGVKTGSAPRDFFLEHTYGKRADVLDVAREAVKPYRVQIVGVGGTEFPENGPHFLLGRAVADCHAIPDPGRPVLDVSVGVYERIFRDGGRRHLWHGGCLAAGTRSEA